MPRNALLLCLVASGIAAALLAGFTALPASGRVRPSDGHAAKHFAAWLAVFNAADRDKLLEYHQQWFPYSAATADVRDLEHELGLSGRTRGFDLVKTEEATATTFTAILKERRFEQLARATMRVDSTAPHRVVAFEIHPIPTPAELMPARLSESDLIAVTRKKLAEEVAADRFAGAVLIVKNGKPVLAEAYGLADREHKAANALRTRFRIGSMNKMFTAVATLQLVQSGKLALETPIGQYLTDYLNRDVATKVTIHQLLTHTGGTGDIFGPEFDAHRLELRTLQDYVKLYGKRGLEFAPGSQWDYSNYVFILLGVLIERVSGQSYYDYVRQHVYAPAGMASTGSEPEDQAVPDRSVGYTKSEPDAPWRPNTDTLPYRGTSAGGGYSTVDDLLRFATALQQHKLLDAHFTELLTTGKPGTPGDGYAYGFEDRTINGVRCFGHGGGSPGMNGDLKICPDVGWGVAVLANLDPPIAGRLSLFITQRLPR
jgi:D-alanyl-D-alanine carboxypeptidase